MFSNIRFSGDPISSFMVEKLAEDPDGLCDRCMCLHFILAAFSVCNAIFLWIMGKETLNLSEVVSHIHLQMCEVCKNCNLTYLIKKNSVVSFSHDEARMSL